MSNTESRTLATSVVNKQDGGVRVDEKVVLETLNFVFFNLRCQIRYI